MVLPPNCSAILALSTAGFAAAAAVVGAGFAASVFGASVGFAAGAVVGGAAGAAVGFAGVELPLLHAARMTVIPARRLASVIPMDLANNIDRSYSLL